MQAPKDWHLILVIVGIVGIDILLTVPFHIVYALGVSIEYGFYKSSVNVRVVVETSSSIHYHTILTNAHTCINNVCMHAGKRCAGDSSHSFVQ